MNLAGKEGLDALLKDWPAPPPGSGELQDVERMWDERADATVKAALEGKGAAVDLDALLAAPALPPEAGESGITAAPPSIAPAPGERKRTSLKEIAARASQAGARPSSAGRDGGAPHTPGPRPSSPGTAPPSIAPGRPSSPAPLPRPSEAGKEDSGVINLNVVQASVTAQERAAAEKAQPGQVGLFDDDKTEESPVNPAQQPTPAKAPSVAVISPRRTGAGPIAGIAIAVLGIAAAFAIVTRKPAASTVADSRPAVTAAPAHPETPKPPGQTP
jgi:hypothetical protein